MKIENIKHTLEVIKNFCIIKGVYRRRIMTITNVKYRTINQDYILDDMFININ